jgi:hypothetical protein
MSDQSQGPGWWQASDGKWYPPEQAPPPTQPEPASLPTATPRSGLGTGPIIAIVVAVVAILATVLFFATKDDGNKKNAAVTQSSSAKSSSSSSRSSGSRASSSSSGAPQITAPAGFTAFSNDADRFAIAIPDRLEVIDLSAADLDQVLQQLSDNNPQLAKLAPQIKQVFQNGGKLFAIDTTSDAGGFNDNLNIIATTGSVDVTSAATKSQAESQLSAVGATNVSFDTLSANGRKLLVSSYQTSVNSPDGTSIPFFGRQAIVSAAGKVWFITYSSATDDAATFTTLAESFDVNEER